MVSAFSAGAWTVESGSALHCSLLEASLGRPIRPSESRLSRWAEGCRCLEAELLAEECTLVDGGGSGLQIT